MWTFNIISSVILIVILLLLIGLGMKIARSKLFSGLFGRRLLPGYIVILAVAFVLSFFLSFDEGTHDASDNVSGQGKVPNLYMTSAFDEIKDDIADYKVDEWTFETDAESLELSISGLEDLNNVLVEGKQDSDGVVEAMLYVTPYVIKGVDMTTGLTPKTSMRIKGKQLIVKTPEPKNLDVSVFQKNFATRQFTQTDWFSAFGDNGMFGSYGSEEVVEEGPWLEEDDDQRIHSTELLYLKVPADMSLEGADDLYIEWTDNGYEE